MLNLQRTGVPTSYRVRLAVLFIESVPQMESWHPRATFLKYNLEFLTGRRGVETVSDPRIRKALVRVIMVISLAARRLKLIGRKASWKSPRTQTIS